MHSLFQQCLLWCSGASQQTLNKCPDWEKQHYMQLGMLVLVPTLFAFLVGYITGYSLSKDPWISLLAGMFWGFILFAIDRYLVANYRPYGRLFSRHTQIIIRLAYSCFLGWLISHSLVLLLFKDAIDAKMTQQMLSEIQTAKADLQPRKDKLLAQVIQYNENAHNVGSTTDDPIQQAEDHNQELHIKLDLINTHARKDIERQQHERNELITIRNENRRIAAQKQEEAILEAAGLRSQLGAKCGDICKTLQAEANHYRQEADNNDRLIKTIDQTITTIETNAAQQKQTLMAAYQQAEQQQHQQQLRLQQAQHQETAAQLRQERQHWLDLAANKKTELNNIALDEKLIDTLRAERNDLMSRTLVLHTLANENPIGYLLYFAVIAFCVLVDMIAVIGKIASAKSPYDTLVHKDLYAFDVEMEHFIKNYHTYAHEMIRFDIERVFNKKQIDSKMEEINAHSQKTLAYVDNLSNNLRKFEAKIEKERNQAAKLEDKDKMLHNQTLDELTTNYHQRLNIEQQRFFASLI